MEVIGRKKYCCKYPGCDNWYYTRVSGGYVNKHFFKFPSDPHYHQLWRDICKADISKNSKFWTICEDHFVDSAFVNVRRDKLNFGAVPIAPEAEDSSPLEGPLFIDVNNSGEEDIPSCSHDDQSSESKSACSCTKPHLFSHYQNSYFQDHDYCDENRSEVPINLSKFAFLEDKDGILSKMGETPTEAVMYRTHTSIMSKLTKLSRMLEKEREKAKILENLYKAGKFQFIDDSLNFVTKEFINSHLPNASSAGEWTRQDKAFALSLYQKSPRLYKYLQAYFQLPCPRTLELILEKIPFETGVAPCILEHLQTQIKKMAPADRHCLLLFNEMSLCPGLYYERESGCENVDPLERINKVANHALVFMVRGIRKQWKQMIAYYFTSNTISANNLKILIKEIISQLQKIGLRVVGTVCDQGTTKCSALSQLCTKQHPYYFFVNNRPIVTIFDVPHLLKDTRNALLTCKIQFAPHKYARFEHIESAFNFDQQKVFKSLPKLKREHFNFKDSYVIRKVEVAAAQLSSSVASTIETLVTFAKILPSEAIFTAEFVKKIDDLFDSLNSSSPQVYDYRKLRCALSGKSPHLKFWAKLLTELDQWKIIDLETDIDVTDRYSVVGGWQTTIRSVIFLWNYLKDVDGFDYLSLRSLNQDPLENLFASIRQHSSTNTKPTCHEFAAALKTVVVNKLVSPTGVEGSCENDMCTPLEDLTDLIK